VDLPAYDFFFSFLERFVGVGLCVCVCWGGGGLLVTGVNINCDRHFAEIFFCFDLLDLFLSILSKVSLISHFVGFLSSIFFLL
jgi:hypothetical protein